MNALRALPQQHFLLQRSTILSFCAAKTTQALIHSPHVDCAVRVLADASLMLIFSLFNKHFVSIVTVIRIHTAWFMFSAVNKNVSGQFISFHAKKLVFSRLAISILLRNTPFNPLLENFQRCFWWTQTQKTHAYTHRHAHTHTDNCWQREKEWSFPSFSLLIWGHPSIGLFELMCAYIPIMMSSHGPLQKDNNKQK